MPSRGGGHNNHNLLSYLLKSNNGTTKPDRHQGRTDRRKLNREKGNSQHERSGLQVAYCYFTSHVNTRESDRGRLSRNVLIYVAEISETVAATPGSVQGHSHRWWAVCPFPHPHPINFNDKMFETNKWYSLLAVNVMLQCILEI